MRDSTVTTTNYQTYVHYDVAWATSLCMLSIVLLLAALASAVLSFSRLAPDCTDFLLALALYTGRIMLEGGRLELGQIQKGQAVRVVSIQ